MKKQIFIIGNTRDSNDVLVRKARFQNITDKVRALQKDDNHIIFVPTLVHEPTSSQHDAIRSDITKLMSCSDLYLINGWQSDKHSNILRNLAMAINIKLHYL